MTNVLCQLEVFGKQILDYIHPYLYIFSWKDRRFTTLMSLSCMNVVGCHHKIRIMFFCFVILKVSVGYVDFFSNLSTSRYLRSPRLRILVRYVSRYLGSVKDRKPLITRMKVLNCVYSLLNQNFLLNKTQGPESVYYIVIL